MKLKKLFLMGLGLCLSSVMIAQDLSVQANEKGKLGYANSMGVLVIPCQFDVATPFHDGVARVAKKDKWGLIDIHGTEVVKCAYEDISLWGFNLFRVKVKGKYGIINKEGTFIVPAEYAAISDTNSHGQAWLKMVGKKNATTYGMVNGEGMIWIPATYGGVYEFTKDASTSTMYHEGFYPEYVESRSAVNDTLSSDCEYVAVTATSSFTHFGVYYKDGTEIMPIGNHWNVFKPMNGMIRWYDTTENAVVSGYYNIAAKSDITMATANKNFKDINYWTHGDFHGELAPVNDAAGWFFINKSGDRIKSGYNNISFNKGAGLWAARVNGKDGAADHTELFDVDGNAKLTDKNYERVTFSKYEEDCNFMGIRENGKWGVADIEGTVFVPCTYENIFAPRYGIVYVKQGGKWGAIDIQNNEIVPCNYINLKMNTTPNPKGLWVQDTDSLYHVFVTGTKTEAPGAYTSTSDFKDGFAWARPQNMELKDIQLNRAQVGLSITAEDAVEFTKQKRNFGYIVGEDGQVYFGQPVAYRHYDTVINRLKEIGKPMTPGLAYGMLLNLTSGSRKYAINGTIQDWDF